jgi:hypothetical protein
MYFGTIAEEKLLTNDKNNLYDMPTRLKITDWAGFVNYREV